MQIVLLVVFGNRAVENAVDVAADGRHGRFELVRYVRNELLPPLLRLLERVCHRVEGQRKVVDLLRIFAGLLGAKFGFSVAEPARHIRHLAERPDKRARQEGRRNERQA